MPETQFRAEMRYQVAIAMAKTLLTKGLLTPDEYGALAVHFVENPLLNGGTIRLYGAIRMAPR